MLAITTKDHPFDWEEQLQRVCFAYNTSVQASTGYTPFFLMFGREARMPIDLMYQTGNQSNVPVNDYAVQLKSSLEDAYRLVREKIGTTHQRQKDFYDRKVRGEPYNRGGGTGPVGPVLAGPFFMDKWKEKKMYMRMRARLQNGELERIAAARILKMAEATAAPVVQTIQYCPPATFVFPKRAFGKKKIVHRSCQASWFKTWSWLHYDQSSDQVFCHICQKATHEEKMQKGRGDQVQ